MAEWDDGVVRNKSSIVLWGILVSIAFLRYFYIATCGGRQYAAPVDPEQADAARSRNKAAEESLIDLLDRTTRVRRIWMYSAHV